MDYIKETQILLGLSPSQFADLFGITYTDMVDIINGTRQPSAKLVKGCQIARNIFLENLTHCVLNKGF